MTVLSYCVTVLQYQQTKTNVKQKRLGALKTQAVSIPPGLIVVNATEDYNYRITNATVRFVYFLFVTEKRKLTY